MMTEQLPVYWYSGLYLQPQHFQSTDLNQSWQHAQHWQKGKPWQNGVISAEINSHSLLDFTLEFRSLELITPEGILITFPGNGYYQKRNFRQAWKYRDHPFTIWAALRRLDPQQENVTVLNEEGEQPSTRWVTLPHDNKMRDLYHKGPEMAVPRVVYNLRLLWEHEREEVLDDECFPLLRVRMRDQDVIVDETYAPPGITLKSSDALYNKIEAIFFELTNRARSLSEFKHSECQLNSEVSNESFIMMLVMRSLNRTLPALKLYLHTPGIHPWQVYFLLAQLIGELSTFNDDCNYFGEWSHDDIGLTEYDHHDLFHSFDQIQQVLTALLNSFVLEDNTYQKLNRSSDNIYTSQLNRQTIMEAKGIYLMLRSESLVSDSSLIEKFGSVKLADLSDMDSFIAHALPGIPLNHCVKNPGGLPKRSDTRYLAIDTRDPRWIKVEQSQQVGFFWTHAPEDMQVQIVYAGVR